MNRLIIIGNGFDLAHGIKSSFKDFIIFYFRQAINQFLEKDFYKDDLLSIDYKNRYVRLNFGFKTIEDENTIDFFKELEENNQIITKLTSPLLEYGYNNLRNSKWVDFELAYFENLSKTQLSYKRSDKIDIIDFINKDLTLIKKRFIEYLTEQQYQFSNTFNKADLVNCFTEGIFPHEVTTKHLSKKIFPSSLYFLNFNYTDTFLDYEKICGQKFKCDKNYIHGSLDGILGDPIFGYGDELNKAYLEFEEDNNNELFRHIKSFGYLQNQNYSHLIKFIDSDIFQIHIYGHSCGLSDRTLLNQIFEHDNCLSIKIFYHEMDNEINDFTDKTYEISRHFKNKTNFRKKLVSFKSSSPMPQPKK